MIIDNIKNHKKYSSIHDLFNKAFDFLANTNFNELKDGEYPILDKECFAIVSRYKTREVSEAFLESHRKYIDIQFMAFGNEKLGYSDISKVTNLQYSEESDIQKHMGELDFIGFSENQFAILYPNDIHMPGIINEMSTPVLKVVVKVRV